jgi:hypothetical protein
MMCDTSLSPSLFAAVTCAPFLAVLAAGFVGAPWLAGVAEQAAALLLDAGCSVALVVCALPMAVAIPVSACFSQGFANASARQIQLVKHWLSISPAQQVQRMLRVTAWEMLARPACFQITVHSR